MVLDVDDEEDDLGYDQDALSKMLAEVQARAAETKAAVAAQAAAAGAGGATCRPPSSTLTTKRPSSARGGAEPSREARGCQGDSQSRGGGGRGGEEAESEDDLPRRAAVEMTRKERLRQLKAAKAFFKADAKAAERTARGEVLEDEAELSEWRPHRRRGGGRG